MLNVHLCTVSLPRSVPTPSPCYSLPIARGEINSPLLMLFPTQVLPLAMPRGPHATTPISAAQHLGGPEIHFLALFGPTQEGRAQREPRSPSTHPRSVANPQRPGAARSPPGASPEPLPVPQPSCSPAAHPPRGPGASPRRPRAPPGRTHPARAARSRRHPGNGRFRRQGRAGRGLGAALVPQEGRRCGGDVLAHSHSFPVLFGGWRASLPWFCC